MAFEPLEIDKQSAVVIIIILSAIYTIILSPLSLFYAYKLWVLNTENIPFITKRRPRIVIFSVLFFNAYIITIKPICDLTTLYGLKFVMLHTFLYNLYVLIMIITSLRVWLLFYDYNYQLQTLALKWQTLITKTIPTKIQWTQRYKWMGNVKILLIITGVVCTVFLTATTLCFIIFGALPMYYTRMVIFLLFVTFIAFLTLHVRSCRDEFYIQREFKLLMIFMMIGAIIYCIYQPLFDLDSNTRLVITNIWMSSSVYIFSFIHTYWVMKNYDGAINENMRLQSHSKASKFIKLSLEVILQTKDGFDMFANHLLREFSSENLFFVYEVMQAKNEMLMKQLVQEEDVGFMMSFDMQMQETIHRPSATVNDVNDFRRTVRYIMGQYMQSNAAFCVNVSSHTRIKTMETYRALEGGGKLVVEASVVFDGEETTNTHHRIPTIIRPISQCAQSLSQIQVRHQQTATHSSQISLSQIKVKAQKSITPDVRKINDLALNKQYIVIFDDAMKEIVFLMRTDSLKRFYRTEEYKRMIQHVHI